MCDQFVGGLLKTVFPRFFIDIHFINAFILALSSADVSAELFLVYAGLIPGLVGLTEAKKNVYKTKSGPPTNVLLRNCRHLTPFKSETVKKYILKFL